MVPSLVAALASPGDPAASATLALTDLFFYLEPSVVSQIVLAVLPHAKYPMQQHCKPVPGMPDFPWTMPVNGSAVALPVLIAEMSNFKQSTTETACKMAADQA